MDDRWWKLGFLPWGVESCRKAREGNEMIHVVTNYKVGDISMNLHFAWYTDRWLHTQTL